VSTGPRTTRVGRWLGMAALWAAGLVQAADLAAPPCTATGMFGHRFGDKPGREATRISESDYVATYRVPSDAPPFTERFVRIDKAKGEIIEVEGQATMTVDEAQAWMDAYKREHPPAPTGRLAPLSANRPGFTIFNPGHVIAARLYPLPRTTVQVQLSFSCQWYRGG
jgi:hypothetical protein